MPCYRFGRPLTSLRIACRPRALRRLPHVLAVPTRRRLLRAVPQAGGARARGLRPAARDAQGVRPARGAGEGAEGHRAPRRPGHARDLRAAEPHVHHPARARGHPPAREQPGRRARCGRGDRLAHRDVPGRAAVAGGAAPREDPHRVRHPDRARGRQPQADEQPDGVHGRDQPARERGRRHLAPGHGRPLQRTPRPARRDAVEGDLRPSRRRRGQVRGRGERHRVDRGEESLMHWPLPLDVTLIVALALAFDFSNGFHDAANSIATVVSTRVLSPRLAVAWAAAFNFVAFAVFGVHVARTIAKGTVDPAVVTPAIVLASLLAALAWNLLTWWWGLPTSSSHALIGGFVGAAVVTAGPRAVVVEGVIKTVLFIVVSPLVGLVLGFLSMLAVSWIFRRASPRGVDQLFRRLQLFSAAMFSLGHGSNDAQKTAGIITALLYSTGQLHGDFQVPLWVVISSYGAIGLGTLSGGWRIVETMGMRITKLQPVGGFCAETSGALALFGASALGVPVSTTHTITGAIVGSGVSAYRRLSAVKWGVASRIVWAWVVTMPAAALIASMFLIVIRGLGMR